MGLDIRYKCIKGISFSFSVLLSFGTSSHLIKKLDISIKKLRVSKKSLFLFNFSISGLIMFFCELVSSLASQVLLIIVLSVFLVVSFEFKISLFLIVPSELLGFCLQQTKLIEKKN